MDLDVDTYSGVLLDVRFEVMAEIVYEGSMMNYTVQDTIIFQVRNSKQIKNVATTTPCSSEETKGEG